MIDGPKKDGQQIPGEKLSSRLSTCRSCPKSVIDGIAKCEFKKLLATAFQEKDKEKDSKVDLKESCKILASRLERISPLFSLVMSIERSSASSYIHR